ncbi:MAG TPA: hypothetical protein DCF33_09610 [Saprospirales bacterium]|nr:hypothetical protein [Saprospirales bacterium]
MRSLPQIIWLLLLGSQLIAQNPHGTQLKVDCRSCHTPDSWEIAPDWWQKPPSPAASVPRFNHSVNTDFELEGRHQKIDCRACHETLVFAVVGQQCIDCHIDLHQQTLGTDCRRCHDANDWLIDDITALHQDNGFPLLGNHLLAECTDCHHSESYLKFERIGNLCVDCHLQEFQATTSPNHVAAGYSTDCSMCHDMTLPDWRWVAGAANHLFFPLTGGHAINDCTKCHIGGNFTNTPTDCFACHSSEYMATTNPDHEAAGFPTDCSICHTTGPGWAADNFTQHDALYFPIYSGNHKGEWNNCNECHTTAGNFKAFSCIDCHEHNNAGDLADEHDEVGGYSFNSTACYSCHPKGN